MALNLLMKIPKQQQCLKPISYIRMFMNGLIIINKEKDKTSRDVVNALNHLFNTKKIGHTGTLDPLATGVLVCVIGKYTKLVELLSSETKEYIAEIKLGQKVTVTADFGNDKRYDYHGEVVWIASQSEFTPKTIQTADSRASLVYAVKILVKNDGRLKIGTYGEVRL